MQPQFVIRLIDLTLLLLLSLLAVVRLTDRQVSLPHSTDLEDRGALPWPLEAAVTASGGIVLVSADTPQPVTARELAEYAAQTGRPVELRVDASARADRLLEIHNTLQAFGHSAAFLVEHRAR